jgi:hypothetical protein
MRQQPRRFTQVLSLVSKLWFFFGPKFNHFPPCSVTAQDIAEEIVWAASRPPHVNIAEVLVFPVNQASAGIKYQAP